MDPRSTLSPKSYWAIETLVSHGAVPSHVPRVATKLLRPSANTPGKEAVAAAPVKFRSNCALVGSTVSSALQVANFNRKSTCEAIIDITIGL
jgi:hypothetical protein